MLKPQGKTTEERNQKLKSTIQTQDRVHDHGLTLADHPQLFPELMGLQELGISDLMPFSVINEVKNVTLIAAYWHWVSSHKVLP